MENENKELVKMDSTTLPQSAFSSVVNFEATQRMAKLLSESKFVPAAFRGKQNIPDVVIALEMSRRLGADVIAVMQSLYIVHGKPAWSAQFVIACINSCGLFTPLQFEFTGSGDKESCVAHAIVKATGERVEGPSVSVEMAKAEGWYDKKDNTGKNISKWPTMTGLMLRYRAATFFGRLYAPQILMGMRTVDEVQDIIASENKTPVEPETPPPDDEVIDIEPETDQPVEDDTPPPVEDDVVDAEFETPDETAAGDEQQQQHEDVAPDVIPDDVRIIIDQFKRDLETKDSVLAIDRYMQKHHKRIERALPIEAHYMIVTSFADDLREVFRAAETKE